MFEEGEIMKTIALIVLSDDFPELDETIVVTLSMPTNGATIATDRSTVTVVIQANDGVAGVVGFSPLSRSAVVGEGESAEFSVERTLSALGRVEVNWTITGNSDPTLEFTAVAGTAVFMEVGDGRPAGYNARLCLFVCLLPLQDTLCQSLEAIVFCPCCSMFCLVLLCSSRPHLHPQL